MAIAFDANGVRFDENGLVPCIVQDAETGRVLTLAYMNRESLLITCEEEKTCFWSRSRKTLWRKGETSGNFQHVLSLEADCDGDAILARVRKEGPACHRGTDSCFDTEDGTSAQADAFSFDTLYTLLLDRKAKMPEGSYTTYLFEKGLDKILKKVGEESTEVIIAAKDRDRKETVYELADLAYHALVLMAESGITPDEVRTELASRHIIDHKVKQEKMT